MWVTKMCDEIEKCCRLCLDVESSHVSIFGDPTIRVHMRACLGVNVFPSDPLPTDICLSCVSQLSQFYHFQINARCSQEWLASAIQEKSKKLAEKTTIHPLPDSEYNSDSLLEFLNNTANIEEYLNNLGKEDIPAIVNMLDRNEQAIEACKLTSLKTIKQPSPKKKDPRLKTDKAEMEIDVLDSDVEIVKEIILKEDNKAKPQIKIEKKILQCYGCKIKFEGVQKFSQHFSTCELATRTCFKCDKLFDSRLQMLEHSVSHNIPLTCNCGEQFSTKERLINHQKGCHADYAVSLGMIYRCKQCGDTFKDRFQLYKHVKMHIMKTEEKKCDVCGNVFIGNELLAKHKKKEHENAANSMFRCKICNKTSKNHQEMYVHIQTHTTLPVTSHSRHLCETCGRSFTTRALLSRHCTQHNRANKLYNCSICGKCFKNQKEKSAHVLDHGDVAMCERCGQTVSSEQFDGHFCG